MCTAITLHTKDHYFGRNLDLEYTYNETVTITPRNYPFYFRSKFSLPCHHAIIGMAYVNNGYPLYYDAMNEMGLSMTGLHFPGNAIYLPSKKDMDNIAPFEFIPWILGQCSTVKEARNFLRRINLIDVPFSNELPITPLHFMISDKNESIVIEPLKDGIKIYDNPVGVLTNNPPFDIQLSEQNKFEVLPGDWSSQSRFAKAAFVKSNSVCESSEQSSVNQFFHILNTVAQPRISTEMKNGLYEITVYSSCCNLDKGIYYYKTYDNSQIIGVDMFLEDLEYNQLISYLLLKEENFFIQNKNV